MPDISMCTGAGCEVKESCYRFTAEPNEYRQAYFTTPPFIVNNGKQVCEFYCPNYDEEA